MIADWYAQWSLDFWIAATAALAAMACALPGVYLVLRRQSMMGDALSHTVLPGIVVAYLAAQAMTARGWLPQETYESSRHLVVFVGALAVGILTALLTEWVQRFGRVESTAALGVVFTSLFALGLLLIRATADRIDLDPECVLYGTIETVVMDTVGGTDVPRAAAVNAAMLAVNVVLVVVFYKELKIAAFDPALATAMGYSARRLHYGLMAVTAATLVAAFESVGSILVIAMLIIPAATAWLLTARLWKMIVLALVLAAVGAVGGHVLAITLPGMIFGPLGFPEVTDASTAGMVAVASGLLFFAAVLFAPRSGVLARMIGQGLLSLKIAGEDVLGLLLRAEEMQVAGDPAAVRKLIEQVSAFRPVLARVAVARLRWQGKLAVDRAGMRLTERGRQSARGLLRSHRLWESYMAKHLPLADDHLHESAERVEHFIDPALREELAAQLDRPETDPHGKSIPPEGEASQEPGPQEPGEPAA